MTPDRQRGRSRPAAWTLLGAALALLLVASGCSMSAQARARETELRAQERVVRGESLLQEGDLDDALAEFAAAIEENPTLTPAHMGMGEIYRLRGNYIAAERSYRRAVDLEPQSAAAQYNHALALQLLDRLTEAVRAYLRALSIAPDDFNANLNLATAYLQLEEARQSLPYARRAVALDPQDGPARVNLGAVHAALSQHEQAIREYQAAAELMEVTPPLLLNLANSLGKTGRYTQMVNTLGRLLRLEPSAQAHERLGFAYFRLHRYEEALESFRAAADLDPEHYPAWNGVGVCLLNRYLMNGESNDRVKYAAVEALRKSLRLNRDQPQIVQLVSDYTS